MYLETEQQFIDHLLSQEIYLIFKDLNDLFELVEYKHRLRIQVMEHVYDDSTKRCTNILECTLGWRPIARGEPRYVIQEFNKWHDGFRDGFSVARQYF